MLTPSTEDPNGMESESACSAEEAEESDDELDGETGKCCDADVSVSVTYNASAYLQITIHLTSLYSQARIFFNTYMYYPNSFKYKTETQEIYSAQT